MVHRTSKRRFVVPIIFIIVVVGVFAGLKFINRDTAELEVVPEVSEPEPEPEPEKPALIDFQPTIDSWLASFQSSKADAGVYIYDMDNDTAVGEYTPDESFWTASLYKLFVVYEGYRRLENGTENPNTKVAGHTYSECLDLAIRQSHSACAEAIHLRIGADNLANIIKNDYGLTHSSATGLYSTPREMVEMLKIYYNHKELSDATWATIQDSMLNQPPTNNGMCRGACDWRQGLPSGFSQAKVYNKVGWQGNGDGTWKIYDDVAIIELAGHTYFISVMSNNVYPAEIAKLGSAIETLVLAN